MLRFLPALALLLAVVPATGPAFGQPVRTSYSEAELVLERAGVVPGGTVQAGLRLKHKPRWHSYWRNPGDSGLPTEIAWNLPAGWKAGEIAWPVPKRLPVGDLVNYGYEGEVLLTVPLTAPADAKPGEMAAIKAEAVWLVCEKICVPEEAALALQLPVVQGAAKPTAQQPLFAKTQARLPMAANWAAGLSGDGERLRLVLPAKGFERAALTEAYFFAFDPDAVHHSARQPLKPLSDGFALELVRGVHRGQPVKPVSGVLTYAARQPDGSVRQQAIEIRAEPQARHGE